MPTAVDDDSREAFDNYNDDRQNGRCISCHRNALEHCYSEADRDRYKGALQGIAINTRAARDIKPRTLDRRVALDILIAMAEKALNNG